MMQQDFEKLASLFHEMEKHALQYGKLRSNHQAVQHGGHIGGISGRSGIGEDYAASRAARIKADQEAALSATRDGVEQTTGRGQVRSTSLAEQAAKKRGRPKKELTKQAATTSEVMKEEKIKNKQPTPSLFSKERYKQPENFAEGYKTYTKIRPDIDETNKSVGYNVSTAGYGRVNQQLLAERFYDDLLQHVPMEESEEAYLARRNANVDRALAAYEAPAIAGHATNLAMLGGGAAMGYGLSRVPMGGVVGGVMGGVLGTLPNALLHQYADYRKARTYLDGLTPAERDLLLEVKQRDAQDLSQNARNADKLTATNTYYV